MVFEHAYIFPIIAGTWFIFTFLLTYGIAVLNGDVVPVFPYISDTGTWAPESCIFGLMLNIGSVLMAITMYLRYRQIRYLCEKFNFKHFVTAYNKAAVYIGFLASFGTCIVGNFQETNVFSVHIFGALLAFGMGFIYQCLHAKISFEVYPTFGNKCVNIIRFISSVVCLTTFLITFVFAGLSLQQFEGQDKTKWHKDDGGFTYHFVSTVAEWILAIFTMAFLVSYTKEFKSISINEPQLTMKEEM